MDRQISTFAKGASDIKAVEANEITANEKHILW